MLKHIFFFFIPFCFSYQGLGQKIEPQNGVYHQDNTLYALINVDVQVNAEERVENATILFQNGKILKVGKLLSIPKNAVKIDREGFTVYASFIDPYSSLGMPKATSKKKGFTPQLASLKSGPYYWNESIHPEVNAYEIFDEKLLAQKKQYLAQGFGVVSSHQKDGILRGTSTVLSLGDGGFKNQIIKSIAANHYSFKKGVSKQTYPSSQMGAIALIRQFFYDLRWYTNLKDKPNDNISFSSVAKHLHLPNIFEVSDQMEIFRVLKIGDELEMPFVIFGSGDEYKRVYRIRERLDQMIIPLNFPKPFEISDPFISRYIKLSDLKHWELAPYNPYILSKNGIEVSFSMFKTKNKKEFLKHLRSAVKHGLSRSDAMRALTENPAQLLKIEDKVGTLEQGKLANFIIVKGDIFEDGEIYENWVRGVRHMIKPLDGHDLAGGYDLNIDGEVYAAKIKGEGNKLSAEIENIVTKFDSVKGVQVVDTLKSKMIIKVANNQFSGIVYLNHKNEPGVIQLNGTVHSKLGLVEGNAQLNDGSWVKWSGIRSEKTDKKTEKKSFEVDTSALERIYYPNMAFGFDSLPGENIYFIKNATIWTNEKEGVVKNGNLLIKNGKIVAVNKRVNAYPNNTIVIDARGKHVTCGIIDEHSHIAISKGVNEGGQAISAEVSIGDVVRSNDINIYRQLAGGVTCSQLLHGSANPIGGQSALVKLKWGVTPDEMLVKNAAPFIKFALGENVKQSNWGDFNRVRFPQTRMGVEQVFYDAFLRAKNYKMQWAKYRKMSEKEKAKVDAPRRNLELETILQIIEEKRFVTCHSYIQSEINMLMKVADSVGFTLNTFTHILEGYKVADKMKAHGAGASTFSDWWAYKYEVNEAIPFNAAILQKMGIITAINSDDAEMGRRLNHEAAKIVKYGGVTEEEAWKMITLNPAKLLHVDDRMGSIKTGKDADIVIWSDHPLSINAKVEQTFIEGILYYDHQRNEALYQRDQLDRKRIIELMLKLKQKGKKTQKPKLKVERHYHCDTMGE